MPAKKPSKNSRHKTTKSRVTAEKPRKQFAHPVLAFALLIAVLAFNVGLLYMTRTKPSPISRPLGTVEATDRFRTQHFYLLTQCGGQDNRSENDRGIQFEEHLKINSRNDRIVARGCNDIDTLYFYVQDEWRPGFSINTDFEQYYRWQQACHIEDITKAGTVQRPENVSLDGINYDYCAYVDKYHRLPAQSGAFL